VVSALAAVWHLLPNRIPSNPTRRNRKLTEAELAGRQLMTFPAESICFIFSTLRARVSSFLAPEYQTMNSFL